MSGIFTPGLPTVLTAPLSGSEAVPLDTNKASGGYPESIALTIGSGLLSVLGSVQAIADSGVTGSGAVLTADAKTGSYFTLSLAGTGRVLNVIDMSPGQLVELEVTQSGGASRTITSYQTAQAGTATTSMALTANALTLSTTSGSVDVLAFRYNATAAKARGRISSLNSY